MTKQEEIRDVFKRVPLHSPSGYRHEHLVLGDRAIDWVLTELAKLGVVIKVERELPFDKFKDIDHAEEWHGLNVQRCPRCQLLKLMLAYGSAGYVAVEPLVEE